MKSNQFGHSHINDLLNRKGNQQQQQQQITAITFILQTDFFHILCYVFFSTRRVLFYFHLLLSEIISNAVK